MNTATETTGLTNGYHGAGRQARRSATGFLSEPCNRFEMPPQKRNTRTAGTRPRACHKRQQRYDNPIITRYSLPARVAIYVVAALTVSGLLPMALAALQIHLTNVYGLGAFLACVAVDGAFIGWMVRQ